MKKKVALLGDSIRMIGYGTKVPEMLGEAYEVFQPEENCRFVKYTLRMLFDYKEQLKDCEVIHWNNGLWDVSNLYDDGKLFSTDEEYVENMLRVARELKKITPNLIFATTTPVHPEYPYNDNADIARFNSLVVPRLQEMGFKINDLHAVVAADIEKNICEDQIHLSEAGALACAEKVVAAIKSFE
ncbi:MAG: SGNH/GDSL hydrolase family protein [Clostridia bacterium]|nr:SGNH/GDSL hydrolase family protein [Clostridia bacterium]